MDEMDSAGGRALENVDLAGERFSPARRVPLELDQDDTHGAQFTAIAHFQPTRNKPTSRADKANESVASLRRQSATSNSISSSSASERDELESSHSYPASSASRDTFHSTVSRLDRMKALEELTMRKVADSALAAEADNCQLALQLARDALETLNGLRTLVLEEQRIGSARPQVDDGPRETPPMSSGVNLFDLLVMAKSNLAAQLRRAGQLDEALELYTQLCKLAAHQSAGQSATGRHSARFVLYRFGLQMGNLLLELGEPARALKHFRLTLDRLNSSGERQLRVKLMSNIAIALMSAHQQTGGPPPSHLGAMQRLLADNLLTGHSQPQQQQQRNQPQNANHHRFGLNLVASYHEQADLSSMRATLGLLLKVDICHHYGRVLANLDSPLANQKHDLDDQNQQQDDRSSGAAHARERRTASGAVASAADAERRVRQVMSAIRADKLESIICERRNEIASAILTSCALIIDQARRLERPSASGATNEDASNDGQSIGRGEVVDSSLLTSADGGRRTCQAAAAALSQCVKLLTASELYGQLANELRLNNVLRSLASIRGLRSTLRSLVEVARDEQRAGATTGGSASAAAKMNQPQQVGHRSPMVAANLALLCAAAGQPARALELSARRALPPDQWEDQLNVANCHLAMKRLEEAEAAAERALNVKPTSWLANYNALLITRLAGRHLDELAARTRKSLAAQLLELQQPRALAKLSIAQLQLALLYKQSAMEAKSASLFERLAGGGGGGGGAARLAPEVSLHASRATAAGLGVADEAATAMLKAATHWHAYHLPTAERLVALHISRFQYREAELLLAACLRNRPDQARWLQLLAECYRRAADYSAAIRVYKHAICLFPADTGCLRALAKLADELGLSEERDECQTRLQTISESRAKLKAAST